jgi:hypothetical protein
MLPGVLCRPFKEGDLLAARGRGNPAPFAMGEAAVGSAEAAAGGMRGKALRLLHHYGDALWAAAGRRVPNAGFEGEVVRPLRLPGSGEKAAQGAAAARRQLPEGWRERPRARHCGRPACWIWSAAPRPRRGGS